MKPLFSFALDPIDAGLALIAATGAWPILACAYLHITQSPLERAFAHAAICGSHAFASVEILGHCPACYVGLAAFLGATLMLSQRLSQTAAQSC
jgi:hypothetical protein